jgi:hypothetical protein
MDASSNNPCITNREICDGLREVLGTLSSAGHLEELAVPPVQSRGLEETAEIAELLGSLRVAVQAAALEREASGREKLGLGRSYDGVRRETPDSWETTHVENETNALSLASDNAGSSAKRILGSLATRVVESGLLLMRRADLPDIAPLAVPLLQTKLPVVPLSAFLGVVSAVLTTAALACAFVVGRSQVSTRQ